MSKEMMRFDVVIVGAGPAGLATACHIKQLALKQQITLEVCVVEKGREVGAHILSGAILDIRPLEELFPDWRDMHAPIGDKVSDESFYFFRTKEKANKIPWPLLPQTLRMHGDYIISLGEFCCWLAKQAEKLGVHIFTGFSATDVIYKDNVVIGVRTGEKGRDKTNKKKTSFIDAIDLHATFCVFSEGSHGQLGKQLIKKFDLAENCTPQHYALGFKEIWEVTDSDFKAGKIMHTVGWPLGTKAVGGGFMYFLKENQISLGLVVDLNYINPYLRPYDEFQCFKQQDTIQHYLKNAKRIAYGARSISKGGYYSLPKMAFPGGFLIGCNAGTFNMARLKGIHTAMKSGMLAAKSIVESMSQQENNLANITSKHMERVRQSWLWSELYSARNRGSSLHKFGLLAGGLFNLFEDKVIGNHSFFSIKDKRKDHQCLKPAQQCSPIKYPAYDEKISFDVSSSLVLANITHSDDQPCHLILADKKLPIEYNLHFYEEPAQRYCSAGVYEVSLSNQGKNVLIINTQNCIHCKVCDIKDPAQNINWTAPEGGAGPNYRNM